ncbi:MAG: hypothetical protein GQ477_01520 [Nanohaloarchaea archaeon]|nr:hypothetical protein [Candidatus Nanohaloarchaea archaeon]
MLRVKTVGYCKYGDLDVYTDRIDNDAFDAAISRFSRHLRVNDGGCSRDVNTSGMDKKEYTFFDPLGINEIEVSYNSKTQLLVVGAKDKSQIEQFLNCVSFDVSSGKQYGSSDAIGNLFSDDEGTKKGNIFSSIKNMFKFGSRKSDPAEIMGDSVLDNCPSAYHFLDDREKKLIDSYESQLLDMEQYAVRKNIVASYLCKVNRSLENVAQMAEKYTIAEERGMDAHDKLIENAQFWKELDYVPSY